jgi:hypothetical protein
MDSHLFVQMYSFLSSASRVLGEPQVWRFHETDDGKWHLFRPSEEDGNLPCPHCPEGPDRPKWAECPEHQERCEHCGFLRKDAHEVPYIPLEMHMRAKLTTEAGCRDMLEAWRCRDRWKDRDPANAPNPQHEYWDGACFRERAAFFDPDDSWQRSMRCTHCCDKKPVFCSEHLALPFRVQASETMWRAERNQYETTCPLCLREITATKEELRVRGDPRNQAFAVHLDGFPAARTTGKLSCVMDAVPLTVSKRLRAHISEGWIWPLMFPPKAYMKRGSESFDIFMLILALDASEVFDEGFVVNYALGSPEVSPNLPDRPPGAAARIRALLFCMFGDYPALADMAKFKRGGWHASRRCWLRAIQLLGRLAYGNARAVARDGCQARTVESVMEAGWRYLRGDAAERKAIADETGCTGFSALLLLWGVFGFDVVRHVCGDFMHKGPENQVKHFQRDTLEGTFRQVARTKVQIAPPRADVGKFGRQQRCLAPTRKLADGRWVKDPAGRSLGWQKAEEHEKAALYCFPTAYAGAIDAEGFAVAELVTVIHQAVYIHGSRKGWTPELMALFTQLCKAKCMCGRRSILVPSCGPLSTKHAWATSSAMGHQITCGATLMSASSANWSTHPTMGRTMKRHW